MRWSYRCKMCEQIARGLARQKAKQERRPIPGRKRDYKSSRVEKFRAFMRDVKDAPCLDCGVKYHFSAMEFDHLPEHPKRFELSEGYRYSIRTLEAEIAKCELVCANCHRYRTWARRYPALPAEAGDVG